MPNPALAPAIVEAVDEQVAKLGLECVDVRFTLEGGRRILRVTIDGGSGVSLEQCAEVSRELGPVLDAVEELPAGYYLEVSSPGINRPLTKPEHYRRYAGERAKLHLRTPLEGGRTLTGILGKLEAGVLEVETRAGLRRVPLAQIEHARLHRDLDQFLKAGRQTSGRKPTP